MLIENKTELNRILKGYINKTAVVLSTIKFKSLYKNYEPEYKEFDLSNFSLKGFQIINIKGFKRFLKNKEITEFKDISGTTTEDLIFNGLTFKKEFSNNDFIAIYFNDERIISLNYEYLKPIFKELKLNQLECLRIFLNNELPVFFEINIKDGFLIAPCMREND